MRLIGREGAKGSVFRRSYEVGFLGSGCWFLRNFLSLGGLCGEGLRAGNGGL